MWNQESGNIAKLFWSSGVYIDCDGSAPQRIPREITNDNDSIAFPNDGSMGVPDIDRQLQHGCGAGEKAERADHFD